MIVILIYEFYCKTVYTFNVPLTALNFYKVFNIVFRNAILNIPSVRRLPEYTW